MKILICGIGSLGSNLTARLASDLRGEHEITVLDKDKVEERNVRAGTQFYTSSQIGNLKTDALQFNIYKNYNKEINIVNNDLLKLSKKDFTRYDLAIDCLDNHMARDFIYRHGPLHVLHIGFSNQFTFAIEWNGKYKVPKDIKGIDICEMQGASAFVNRVASLGALIAEEFIFNNNKLEAIGGKLHHKIFK